MVWFVESFDLCDDVKRISSDAKFRVIVSSVTSVSDCKHVSQASETSLEEQSVSSKETKIKIKCPFGT